MSHLNRTFKAGSVPLEDNTPIIPMCRIISVEMLHQWVMGRRAGKRVMGMTSYTYEQSSTYSSGCLLWSWWLQFTGGSDKPSDLSRGSLCHAHAGQKAVVVCVFVPTLHAVYWSLAFGTSSWRVLDPLSRRASQASGRFGLTFSCKLRILNSCVSALFHHQCFWVAYNCFIQVRGRRCA